MARLFVAVWPPDPIVDELAALPRPELPDVRWIAPDRLHTTLRFLGETDEDEAVAVLSDLELAGVDVAIGPAAQRLGRGVLMLPVAGIDELAALVIDETRELGVAPDDRPFVGHLTVARIDGDDVDVKWPPIDLRFRVDEIALVRVEPTGTYVDVERFSLG